MRLFQLTSLTMVARNPTSTRPGFQRSVSFAGITAHARGTLSQAAMPCLEGQSEGPEGTVRSHTGSRHSRRQHPYRRQMSTSRSGVSAEPRTCKPLSGTGISKKKSGMKSAKSINTRSRTVSYMTALLRCNLTLDSEPSAIDLSQHFPSKDSQNKLEERQHDKEDLGHQCCDEESVDVAFLVDSDMQTFRCELDLNVEKSFQTTSDSVPASPRWGTRAETAETENGARSFSDNSHIWAPNFDDENLWTCLYSGVPKPNRPKQEDTSGKQNDPKVTTSALRKRPTVLLLPDINNQDGDTSDDNALPCFPQSLGEYLSTLNTLYGPDSDYQHVPSSPFPSKLIDLNSGHSLFSYTQLDWYDQENVLFDDECTMDKSDTDTKDEQNRSVLTRLATTRTIPCGVSNEYRDLIPSQSDFCCWMCGSLLERQEIMDMTATDCDLTKFLQSSSIGGMDLFCPHCDRTQCVFNAEDLMNGKMV